MKARGAKYAFDKRSDSELQLWPGTSTERYVTRPFVSARVFGGKGRGRRPLFFWPEFSGADPLARYGILAAARTAHFSGYYQSRSGADFHLAMYTVDGGARLSSESEKFSLVKNSFALIPAGCSYELGSRPSGWKVVWFHISGDVPLPPRVCVSASANCARLRGIFGIYEDEIYSSSPSGQVLEPLAEAIFRLLGRDISDAAERARDADAELKILEVKNSLSRNWTVAEASKFFGLPPKRLDALFKRRFFATFSKTLLAWRMDEARRILSSAGSTLSGAAAEVGYADAFCFSKAFKRHFGMPPGQLRGK
ncbi:MAG: hypothetical protein DBY30_08510 [Verrucomicrobia bacterium]|nr:MAG: hypothetical protein DBY30_08510 [Verrucomicrobiota bacterium]